MYRTVAHLLAIAMKRVAKADNVPKENDAASRAAGRSESATCLTSQTRPRWNKEEVSDVNASSSSSLVFKTILNKFRPKPDFPKKSELCSESNVGPRPATARLALRALDDDMSEYDYMYGWTSDAENAVGEPSRNRNKRQCPLQSHRTNGKFRALLSQI